MDLTKLIESLPKYAQVLYNDCVVQFSKDELLAHPLRRELIVATIVTIRNQLNNIEQHLT